jgi:hypothetical protein
MGLDVYARGRPEFVRAFRDEDDDDGYSEGLDWLYPNDFFPTRACGLVDGWYRHGPLGEGRKHVGTSYSGHNRFREALCRAVYECEPEKLWTDIGEGLRPEEGPFIELINFSDCEGVLGPEVCAKLLADFEAHAERVRPLMGEWAGHYDRWTEMLRTAVAAGGILVYE